MKALNPQITYRDVQPTAALDRSIRASVQRIDRYHPASWCCRVAVEAPHRPPSQGPRLPGAIDVTVPGKELVVAHHAEHNPAHEDLSVALRDAFRAARRELAGSRADPARGREEP
jgi:hypothetical protein